MKFFSHINYYEQLPQNWLKTIYQNVILDIYGGGTPSKNELSYWNGIIPWCSVKDLGSELFLNKTVNTITETGLKNSTAKIVKAGDFILCTRMALGKIRIPLIDMAINQDLKGIKISKYINNKYFLYHILANNFEGTGTTVKGINQKDFVSMPFLLPPICEQKRIIEKIELINQLIN